MSNTEVLATKKMASVSADKFETAVTILLARLSDYPQAQYRLLSIHVHEDLEGIFHGELILVDRSEDVK